jgi:uncharacterized protein DUF2721
VQQLMSIFMEHHGPWVLDRQIEENEASVLSVFKQSREIGGPSVPHGSKLAELPGCAERNNLQWSCNVDVRAGHEHGKDSAHLLKAHRHFTAAPVAGVGDHREVGRANFHPLRPLGPQPRRHDAAGNQEDPPAPRSQLHNPRRFMTTAQGANFITASIREAARTFCAMVVPFPAPPVHTVCMLMASAAENPFAVLTLIAAPAVFTNASSVLALGTGNRLARVVDRTRFIARELHASPKRDEVTALWVNHLSKLEKRGALLVRAMSFFYGSIGAFAAASLVSILGAVLATTQYRLPFEAVAGIGFVAGTIGFVGLTVGCVLLVRETRVAVLSMMDEAELAKSAR